MLKAFDAPRREECPARRSRSNTPLAALVLLNDPTFVQAAQAFARRILSEGGPSTDSKIDFAFRQAVCRKPDDFERKTLKQLFNEPETRDEKQWTSLARAILNLAETNLRR